MTWIYLDDAMPQNPKILQLNAGEFALLVESICYCGRHLTDGTLPESGAKVMRFWTQSRANSLLTFGLWEIQSDGKTAIHDYDQYQRTRAQVQADKDANRERQQRYRERHRNAVTDDPRNALVTEPPNLTSINTPLPPVNGGTGSASKQTRAERQAHEVAQKHLKAVIACRRVWQHAKEDGEYLPAVRTSLEREYRHDPSIVQEAIGAT